MNLPRGANKARFVIGIALLPLAILLQEIAFHFPRETERIYGGWIYPNVPQVLGGLNRLVPFSLAEAIAASLLIGLLVSMVVKWMRRGRRKKAGLWMTIVHAGAKLWILAGFLAWGFLLLWGLNYARPPLRTRMGLDVDGIESTEVLNTGRRCAELAKTLYSSLGVGVENPTTLPLDFRTLNEVIDVRLRQLSLPGDPIQYPTSPVKKLFVSKALCYFGVSGVFIPFTGEPSMNGMIPDVFTPMVVGHEKAHQRGITNEGEASLVAFLACSGSTQHPYLQYSAYLYAAAQLIGAASRPLPNEAKEAWELLGEGPLRDLEAVREFWARYTGRVTEIAEKVNDTYLRSQRVPGGVQSYGQVTQLLVALDRQGKLITTPVSRDR